MPDYTVRDPRTGRSLTMRGPQPPTGDQIRRAFAQLPQAAAPPPMPAGAVDPNMAAPSRVTDQVPVQQRTRAGMERVGDVVVGAVKGAANTAVGLGEMVQRIPGVSRAVDALYGREGISAQSFPEARAAVQPTSPEQNVGFNGEQIGEFLTPVGSAGALRTGVEVAKAALLSGAQGGSGGDVALTTGLAAVIPGAQAVRRTAQAIRSSANPLVRAAIKPTVTSLRRIAGGGDLNAKAERLIDFVIEHRLTTPEKARALFTQTETELKSLLARTSASTDAATRAARYLTALERSAAKQGLGADDVASLRNAAAELLAGPMGDDVVTMVSQAHPTLVNPQGRPIQVLVPQITRQLRGSVPAAEALESARASSRFSTNKQWGEMKGTAVEAQKAVERAQRDAVKEAVPAARPLLQREGQALQSEDVLARMAQRAGNRDAVSLPAHVIAAGEIATGRVPMIAFAANWLRNNQLRAGIWADRLGRAIEDGNAPQAAEILKRLGVATSAVAQARPVSATP